MPPVPEFRKVAVSAALTRAGTEVNRAGKRSSLQTDEYRPASLWPATLLVTSLPPDGGSLLSGNMSRIYGSSSAGQLLNTASGGSKMFGRRTRFAAVALLSSGALAKA
jgi:hypothetical protein